MKNKFKPPYTHNYNDIDWCVCVRACEHLQVGKQHRWVRSVGLHVLHGIPLIDAVLVRGYTGLVVTNPCQKEASWVVIMAPGYLTCLM